MNRAHRSIPVSKARLVQLRAQLKLAREARSLLEEKRDHLVHEAQIRLSKSAELRRGLAERWQNLWQAWEECLEKEGMERLQRLANGLEPYPELEGGMGRLLGAETCHFTASEVQPDVLGAVFDCGLRPERVRGMLIKLLPELIQLMNVETCLRRMIRVLQRVQRQVNALDVIVIPDMEAERRYIEQTMEEREREALFQLKRLKGRT